jgi:hypothetical protein
MGGCELSRAVPWGTDLIPHRDYKHTERKEKLPDHPATSVKRPNTRACTLNPQSFHALLENWAAKKLVLETNAGCRKRAG